MSFSLQLSQFNKKANENIEKARRQILFEVFRAVVMDTPVLEGTLRGNWQIGASAPKLGELDTRSQAAVLSEIEAVLNATRMGETVFLNNNLPYAYPIEYYGHSKIKAPQGMVRKNVIRINRIAEGVARGIRNGTR